MNKGRRNKELRRYFRLHVYHLAKYRPISAAADEIRPLLAEIKDIGGDGVCLVAHESLSVSSLVELKINFPSTPKPLFTLAKVVWVKKMGKGKGDRYEIGLQFTKIDDVARQDIIRRIDLLEHKKQNRGKK